MTPLSITIKSPEKIGKKMLIEIDADKFDKIKKIYEETRSILKTAQKLNLHPSSVHYRLVKQGIIKNFYFISSTTISGGTRNRTGKQVVPIPELVKI